MPTPVLSDPGLSEVEASPQRGSRRRRASLAVGIVASVLLVIYAAGIICFSHCFMPNTSIAGNDVSFEPDDRVEAVLASQSASYALAVHGQGLDFTIPADVVGSSLDAAAVVERAHGQMPAWQWPVLLFSGHDLSDAVAHGYDASALEGQVRAHVDAFNSTAVGSVPATIAYSASAAGFAIVGETYGTKLDCGKVLDAVESAAAVMQGKVELTQGDVQAPAVLSSDVRLLPACLAANKLVGGDVILMMQGVKAQEVSAAIIAQWVSLDADLNPFIDAAKMAKGIDAIVSGLDTIASTRTYTRGDGAVCTVSGGTYGWKVDSTSLASRISDDVLSGRSDTIDVPCLSSAAVYTAPGARDWGARYIDVDLSQQHVRLYDDSGTLVWEADCISGIPDGEHNTPTGVYRINSKASPSKLIGYSSTGQKLYESTVTYWMPFVGNAIGLHDATWQPGFGGTMYRDGYGSHGCVNLSYASAQQLYSLVRVGDVVVSHF